MKTRKTIWMLLALCLLFALPSHAEGNLLANGGFEDGEISWLRDMWNGDTGVSYLAISEGAYSGKYCAMVENVDLNDARYVQEVSVQPDTLYRISCMVRAEGCGEDAKGANISVKGTFASSESVYDTGNGWTKLELYGITGEKQTSLTVMARVGGYSSVNTGKAWFDDFEMYEADDVPGDILPYSFDIPTYADEEGEDIGVEAEAEKAPSPLTGALFSLALNGAFVCFCALLFFAYRRGRISMGRGAAIALLSAAMLLRLFLAVLVRGYGVDMTDFMLWAQRLAETGASGFYSAEYFCDYPPGYLWVLMLAGKINGLFGGAYNTRLFWLLVKLPAILADGASAWLLIRIAEKPLGERPARMLGCMYALCPAVFVNSAAWGQIDALLALPLLLAILLAVKKRWEFALPVYAVSVLVKPQALMFGPFALFVLVWEAFFAKLRVVGGAGNVRITETDDREKAYVRMGIGIALSALAMCAVALPFVVRLPEDAGAKGIAFLWRLYGNTMSTYKYITVNACNLYTLLNLNWSPMESHPYLSAFAYGMLGLSVSYACFLYAKSARRERIFLAGATFLVAAFAFAPMMHERYLFPALLLLCAAYAADRDVRILISALVAAFALGMNEMLVLQNDHLIASLGRMNAFVSALNVLNALLIIWTAYDICVREKIYSFTRIYAPARERKIELSNLFRPTDYRMGFKKSDAILLSALTLLYGFVAFCNLGSLTAPQTAWTSSAAGETLTFDMGEALSLKGTYYGGICTTSFDVEYSIDGEEWTEKADAGYGQGEIFRWKWLSDDPVEARYVRFTAHRGGLILYEAAFLGEDGAPLPVSSVYAYGGSEERATDPKLLLDEQSIVPAAPSWYNGTYFDEIYHARTGYELLHAQPNYEWTHPPLGKLFIALGIQMFGMTPFGWRFMGALFGVLMIPAMYLLVKQLTKRTEIAFVAAFLFATDCMHFTQTRIATIDTFVVLFVMLQYLFMFRYLQMSFYRQRLMRTLVPLALSGIMMGLGIACKWTGAYAGLGLAVLFFISLGRRIYEAAYSAKHMGELDGEAKKIGQRAVKTAARNITLTLLWCVLFFVIVPCLIYYFSYQRQMIPEGGLSVRGVWDLQVSMFNYHNGLSGDTHSFRSPWYEWPLIVKPMWYYTGYDYTPYEIVSSISCMGNPVTWWGGALAMAVVLVGTISFARRDRRYRAVAIGFLAQYVPWIFVARSTYIYHYFASVPFIILATALLFDGARKYMSKKWYRALLILYCTLALLLFVFFYPVASGHEMARTYAQLLRWFNWYNFR
ncbi:MAG: glycosyltransferase family 39 protein [Christensenellales bacterium]|jgi:dolichyl-phosphate-mannose-protein mannosyltransferase